MNFENTFKTINFIFRLIFWLNVVAVILGLLAFETKAVWSLMTAILIWEYSGAFNRKAR